MKNIIFLFLCLSVSISGVFAEDLEKKLKNIDAILDLSGVKKQILQVDDYMVAPLKEGIMSSYKLSEDQQIKLYEVAIKEIKSDLILEGVKNKLVKEWSEGDIESLFNYYNLSKIKNFTHLEEEGSAPGAYAAMMNYSTGFRKNPPAKERVDLIINFYKESKIIDIYTSLTADVLNGVAIGFGQKMSLEQKNKIRNDTVKPLVENILSYSLYIYRDVSNEELKEYFLMYTSNKNLIRLSEILMEEQTNVFQGWGIGLNTKIKEQFKLSKQPKYTLATRPVD